MSHENKALQDLLTLPPLKLPAISFMRFLTDLSEDRDRAGTAHAVALRAIKAGGVENPEEEPDPIRRGYLYMLREKGIPSYKTFYHAAGTQRFAARLMAGLSSASDLGQGLYQYLTIEGGAGSGKDYFLDGVTSAIEKHATVYAVKGCEYHENPINLLKLVEKFAPEKIPQIAEATGIGADCLKRMLAVAGEPCRGCYTKVMGSLDDEESKTPDLACVQVEVIRLNERGTGLAQWKPGGDLTLAEALKKSTRGFLNMPDAFLKREPKQGESDERLLLLDAVQYRRLPGGPLDSLIVASTNKNAYEEYLETLPDREAFTSRGVKYFLPFNTVRVEEERAYRATVARYEKRAAFCPLALTMLATVAVVSRQSVPPSGEQFVHPIDKLRLYQGETINVTPMPGKYWDEYWGASENGYGSSARDRYGNSYGSDSEEGAAMPLPSDEPVTTDLLWRIAGVDEAKVGLDMRYMLSILSDLNNIGVEGEKKAQAMKSAKEKLEEDDGPVRVITALWVLNWLRRIIYPKTRDSHNLTPDQRKVFARVLKWLGGAPGYGQNDPDRPALFEREYRRLLKRHILQVFAPDYETRAQKAYEDYVMHATAISLGKPTVHDPQYGEIAVNPKILDDLDRYRLGRSAGATLTDQDKKFRNSIPILLSDARDNYIAEHGIDQVRNFKETWETIPELEVAIRAKLDEEVGGVVQEILSTEVVSDLPEAKQNRLAEAMTKLEELGYTKACQKPILEYAKRVKVWAHKG